MCQGLVSYAEQREADSAKYALEDKFREGRATTPEKIKHIWERYGGGWSSKDGDYRQFAYMEPVTTRAYEAVNTDTNYETFVFHREVTKTKEFTVTRYSCMGITVEETIA